MNSNFQPLKALLDEMLKHNRLEDKLNQTKIKTAWTKLMGPAIVKYTSDILVVKRKIYITVNSAPLKNELSFAKEKIKNILNEELGEEYIEKVIIR